MTPGWLPARVRVGSKIVYKNPPSDPLFACDREGAFLKINL